MDTKLFNSLLSHLEEAWKGNRVIFVSVPGTRSHVFEIARLMQRDLTKKYGEPKQGAELIIQ